MTVEQLLAIINIELQEQARESEDPTSDAVSIAQLQTIFRNVSNFRDVSKHMIEEYEREMAK